MADILKQTKPKAFLLENVEGLFRHDKGKTFKIIIETLLKELGYKVVGENPILNTIYDPNRVGEVTRV